MRVVVDPAEWAATPEVAREGLRRQRPRLEREPHRVGQRIPRDRWPKRFASAPNLFPLALAEGWRALYVIDSSADAVQVVFIGDHKRYDRLLGYKS